MPKVTGSIPARGRTFSRYHFLGSQHRGWLTTLNGTAVSTELLKIKGGVQNNPEDVKHSSSGHPQGISAPSYPYRSPVSGGGGGGFSTTPT